jgi:hypothetical protein
VTRPREQSGRPRDTPGSVIARTPLPRSLRILHAGPRTSRENYGCGPAETRYRLLHIGPHKTGTTAIQGALHLARERLAAEGVVYPGRGRQPLWPILAVTGQPALRGGPRPEISYWDNLVREVRAAGDQRVVLSSEFFAEADDAAARRVIADLGGARVHVVVTLRSLDPDPAVAMAAISAKWL